MLLHVNLSLCIEYGELEKEQTSFLAHAPSRVLGKIIKIR